MALTHSVLLAAFVEADCKQIWLKNKTRDMYSKARSKDLIWKAGQIYIIQGFRIKDNVKKS